MRGCAVSLLVYSSSCLSLIVVVVGVRGSARAAQRARTLSPNTIVFLLLCSFLSVPRLFSLLFVPRLSAFGMAVCDSPCVGVLCWHDGYG